MYAFWTAACSSTLHHLSCELYVLYIRRTFCSSVETTSRVFFLLRKYTRPSYICCTSCFIVAATSQVLSFDLESIHDPLTYATRLALLWQPPVKSSLLTSKVYTTLLHMLHALLYCGSHQSSPLFWLRKYTRPSYICCTSCFIVAATSQVLSFDLERYTTLLHMLRVLLYCRSH